MYKARYTYECMRCGACVGWIRKHLPRHPGMSVQEFISRKTENPNYVPPPKKRKMVLADLPEPLELLLDPNYVEGGDVPRYLQNY